MIIGKILNSAATLNNFTEIGSLEFIGGEQLTVFVRISDSQIGLRYIPPVTNITTFTINKSDGTTFDVVATPLADDRSIMSFSISELESADMLGGNVRISLDILGDGTEIKKGLIANAFSRIIQEC